MPRKTITLDLAAYRRLKSVKRAGETFSDVIKRAIPRRLDFDTWMASIDKNPLSDEAAGAIEAVVSQRRNLRNRRVRGSTV